ncbi:unnamed protein product [Nippostrongylus brasiliensis]|uniref:EF-hand domain-containing protein n=1 Tax=Nippostrongylus brasiliensis TaxID=27835 RepID=A0A0N4YI25_NIPBR|nr:unnamed protein product [Nippostrongylus brasiliensis]
MIAFLLVSLLVTVSAVPLQRQKPIGNCQFSIQKLFPAAQPGDVWSQICCEDNDLNNNGGINFREFSLFTLNLMNLNRAELERLFLAGDADRNSELDGEECTPMRALLKSTLREKSDILLKQYDTNGDRNLSEEESGVMAKKEFGDRNRVISAGDEMLDLMMNLRTQALVDGRARLSKFDTNKDGKVSYEEIKHDILRVADGFTLKQVFKAVDHDKDFYLTPQEYLALWNELEVRQKTSNMVVTPKTIDMAMTSDTTKPLRRFQRVSRPTTEEIELQETSATTLASSEGTSSQLVMETTAEIAAETAKEATTPEATDGTTSPTEPPSTALTSTEIKIRAKRNADGHMIRVAPSRVMHELSVDDEPLVPKNEQLKKLSSIQNNLSGGGRAPSIDLSVTVPYDSKDFE